LKEREMAMFSRRVALGLLAISLSYGPSWAQFDGDARQQAEQAANEALLRAQAEKARNDELVRQQQEQERLRREEEERVRYYEEAEHRARTG
jgi:hypothetical protein